MPGIFGSDFDLASLGIVVDGSGAIRTLNKLTGSAHNAGRATEHFERTTKNLTSTLRVLGGYFGVRQLVEYADTWTLINARVSLVTRTQEQAMAVQQRLYEISQRTRNTLAATSVLYTRTALNADQLGRSHEDLLKVTEAVNAAMLLSGATGVESAQAMRQFAQALGSGRVQGDEFRTMMEAMPMVARAVADEMGVAMGDLYKLSKKGLVDVQTVIDALLTRHEELTRRAENMPWTIGQVFEVLNNAMVRVFGVLNFATGATREAGKAILWMAANVQILVGVVGAAITAAIAYKAAILAWKGAYVLLALWANRANIQIAIMTAIETVQSFLALAKSVRSAADAMALMSLVSGGVVKAVAVVAAFVAGYAAYEMIVKKITDATAQWENAQGDLTEALGEGVVKLDDMLEKTKQSRDDMIREAHQAVVLAGLQEEAQKRMEIRFDAVNKKIEAGRNLQGESLQIMLAAIAVEERLLLKAYDIELAMKASKEQLEEALKIAERFAENFQRAFGDVFYGILNKGLSSFRELFDGIKRMFFRLLADMVAAKMMQKVGASLAGFMGIILGQQEVAAQAANAAANASRIAMGHLPETGLPQGAVPVQIEGITVTASKSWAAQVAQYLGPAMAGLVVGHMVGRMTSNRALGSLGGAASGALTGAALGSVIPGVGTVAGAVAGGLTGAIGGLIGSIGRNNEEAEKHRLMLEEHGAILANNSERLQDLRNAFQGRQHADLQKYMEFYEKAIPLSPTHALSLIRKLAEEMGITVFDSGGNIIQEALAQLREAVYEVVYQLTNFGENLDDLRARQDYYNKLFDVPNTPQQALQDTYDILSQAAPDLMRQMGLMNLDLTTSVGRDVLLEGLRGIYDLIASGGLSVDLLGAFTDKNQLLDAIIRVKEALNEFGDQLYQVTTDFPRAMDIVYYEQRFGRYGNGGRRPGETGVGSGGHTGTQNYYIKVDARDKTGEEFLQDVERAARQRRARGGRVRITEDTDL